MKESRPVVALVWEASAEDLTSITSLVWTDGYTWSSNWGRGHGSRAGPKTEMTVDMTLEKELKELIIEALMLEDMNADDIDVEAPLFVEGLGLDSIDALELAMAIDKRFGVRIKADDEQNQHIFSNVRSLAEYVGQHRAV